MLCLFLHRNAEFRSNLQKGKPPPISFVGDEEGRMVDNKELESGLKAMRISCTRSHARGEPGINSI
jgi:hypothetical protein